MRVNDEYSKGRDGDESDEVEPYQVVILVSVFAVVAILICTACLCYLSGCHVKVCCRRLGRCLVCSCCCVKKVKPLTERKIVTTAESVKL